MSVTDTGLPVLTAPATEHVAFVKLPESDPLAQVRDCDTHVFPAATDAAWYAVTEEPFGTEPLLNVQAPCVELTVPADD